MFRLKIKTGPVYTVKEHLSVDETRLHCNVPLQCRRVRIYEKTEFPYYSVFIMISALRVFKIEASSIIPVCYILSYIQLIHR